MPSPLFHKYSADIRQAAQAIVAKTRLGQLSRQAGLEKLAGSYSPGRIHDALERYQKEGMKAALQELRGTSFGPLLRSVERYGRSGPLRALIGQFLDELGPAGKLLRALAAPGGGMGGDIRQMRDLVQMFGFEWLGPKRPKPGSERWKRELGAIVERAKQMGFEVVPEGQEPKPRRPSIEGERQPGRPGQGQPGAGQGQSAWQAQSTPMVAGMGRFPPDHPIVTGEMVPSPESSNVHSFGYDYQSGYLYVRFYAPERGRGSSEVKRTRPGSLYRYAGCDPNEFLSLLAAASKGDWVWNHLRIPGTWSGHQKDYELVGIMEGYVPRKATVVRSPDGQLQEWFVRRQVLTPTGHWQASQLRTEAAGRLPFGPQGGSGIPNSWPFQGLPNRAEPDRGEPDRGEYPW